MVVQASKPTPGAGAIRHIPNRATEWYCKTCACFVRPILVRRANVIYPACRECFFDDETEVSFAQEEGHELLEVVPTKDSATNPVASN